MKRFERLIPNRGIDGTPIDPERAGPELSDGILGSIFGGGNNDQTVTNEPWSAQQPYLEDIFGEGQRIYNQGPDYYPDINPIAPLSGTTQQGLSMLLNPSYASQGVRDIVQSGTNAVTDPAGAGNTMQYLQNYAAPRNFRAGGGGGGGGGNTYSGTSALTDTAGVDAAGRLEGILQGENDPRFQEYMQQSGQLITDNLIRNQLLPQQVQQLMGGSYGGAAGHNIRGQTALDVADAMGRNNNALILQNIGNQLAAAGQVGDAQRGVDTFDLGVMDVNQRDDASSRAAAAQRYASDNQLQAQRESNALRAAQFADQFGLDQARLGVTMAPIWDDIQYSDVDRMLRVGNVYDTRAQAATDAAIARELFNQGADDAALGRYAGVVGGGGYGGTQTSSGGGDGGLAGLVGGGLAGLGAYGGLASAGLLTPAAGGATGLGASMAANPYMAAAIIGGGALLGAQ